MARKAATTKQLVDQNFTTGQILTSRSGKRYVGNNAIDDGRLA
jgi:hypothetical protein